MGKIFVIGTGPGSKEFVTPAAVKMAGRADILVGGRKALSLFPNKKHKVIDKHIGEALEFIYANRDKDIAVLTSGDPGFYSILDRILESFPKEDIEVIPGISSIQLCFARIKESWMDARFISLHGRGIEALSEVKDLKRYVILTDASTTPDKVAKFLIASGIDRKAVVCENLAAENERILESSLEDISRKSFTGNCIMVIS